MLDLDVDAPAPVFSPDSSKFILVKDGQARIYDNQCRSLGWIYGNVAPVSVVQFARDGKSVMTAGYGPIVVTIVP